MENSITPQRVIVAPKASVLVESLRDIGYSLQTAIADIIDNSITAGAQNIELLTDTDSEIPAIGILDDGQGMSREKLLEAMRPGSISPSNKRPDYDLGRFGLGLKTASFSQCRRLTVLTSHNGITSCAVWDLDVVAEVDDWVVEFPEDYRDIPWAERLGDTGTLVIWQKLDRLIDAKNNDNRKNLVRQIDETATHLELVFHRFLSGETGLKKIRMALNGRDLESYDPFYSKHPATVFGPEDVFRMEGREIRIQPVTLPHHQKVSNAEWKKYAGQEGYIRNQGFYVYRGKRLIIHGTWFNLARQTELTKLARVRIDMPNDMDAEWKIDVKKSSAQPPAPVRERLRRIINVIGAGSTRTYTTRGRKLTSDNRLPVWSRTQDKNRISYGLNPEHPAFRKFAGSLTEEQKAEFSRLLVLAGAAIPIDALFADISSNPEHVSPIAMNTDEFADTVKATYFQLLSAGCERDAIVLMMSSAEPFHSNWKQAETIINALEEGLHPDE
ncbi:MAG: ATP-binding protein [Rhodobacteraceae bacterium]|nr:ATP-binding protein [Paracoccaceae bacterium]